MVIMGQNIATVFQLGCTFIFTKMMDNLEMLTAREQLMDDIDAIVDEFTFDLPIDDIHERSQLAEDLTRVLCDAVCKNFPTK